MAEGLMISADQLIDIDLCRLWRATCDKRLMRVRHIAHIYDGAYGAYDECLESGW